VTLEEGSEIERLRAEVAALQRKLEEHEKSEAAVRAELAQLRTIFDQLPVAVYAVDTQGNPQIANPANDRYSNNQEPGPEVSAWADKFGIFAPDMVTPYPADKLPIARALAGETVCARELFLRNAWTPDGIWLEAHAAPLRDGSKAVTGAVGVFVENPTRKTLEEEVAKRNKDLLASESEKTELIARLRMAVQELSTPILELWEDVLALPVIGVVDSRRSAEMMERLLDEIVRSQSRFVIIDLTGVEVIDTSTADHFMKLVKAVGLIGARCVLTGIRPAVAQTLVDLDVNFGTLETLRNLKYGLRYCLRWLDAEDAERTVRG
jgi:rsbT co-antagonist protein RsbR